MQKFKSGAIRSSRMVRFDLIPKCLNERLAQRFTGQIIDGEPDGGALKYGEGNWEKGLPTSDVINHSINHLLNYQEQFRVALTAGIHEGLVGEALMNHVRKEMKSASAHDDDLAAAVWGISVLMSQEETGMFHDDNFKTMGKKDGSDKRK